MTQAPADSASHGELEGFLSQYEAAFENDPDYIAEGLALQVTEEASKLMRAASISRSALADLMGVSRSYVTRIMNAPPNLTLRSIAQLAVALGVKPRVTLTPPSLPDFRTYGLVAATDDDPPFGTAAANFVHAARTSGPLKAYETPAPADQNTTDSARVPTAA